MYEFFRHDPDKPFTCFYCGQPADTVDHVPPLSRVNDYRSLKLEREIYVKVACCGECNTLLGNSLQESIVEREDHLKELLADKYKRLTKCLNWTKEALDEAEMTGSLRRYCKQEHEKKQWIIGRLRYYNGVRAFLEKFDIYKSV